MLVSKVSIAAPQYAVRPPGIDGHRDIDTSQYRFDIKMASLRVLPGPRKEPRSALFLADSGGWADTSWFWRTPFIEPL
jgi:hypothetical protein